MATNNKNKIRPLTPKQENFALNLFKGLSQRESWIEAGYSHGYSLARVDSNACDMVHTMKIQCRLQELQEEAKDHTIADVRERKQRLTVFTRETIEGKFGISRQSNITAIAELNRMDHVYDERPLVQDNRTYNVLITDGGDEARDRFNKLLAGKRPEVIDSEETKERKNRNGKVT